MCISWCCVVGVREREARATKAEREARKRRGGKRIFFPSLPSRYALAHPKAPRAPKAHCLVVTKIKY